MNRIILIGNDFDLAHGLKTNYKDFINWYWDEWGEKLLNSKNVEEHDNLCSFECNLPQCDWITAFHSRYVVTDRFGNPKHIKIENKTDAIKAAKQDEKLCKFQIKSELLKKIVDKLQYGWVDIEEEYYTLLIKNNDIKRLNDDLDFIKNKLSEYLNTLEKPIYNENIHSLILQPFHYNDIAIESINTWNEMVKNRLNWNENEWKIFFTKYYNDRDARCETYSIMDQTNKINKDIIHYNL